jgi:signal transduction histidine kinase
VATHSVETLGVGVRGMRERVHKLNGHLEIHSSARGATVRVRLPLHGESWGTESSASASA